MSEPCNDERLQKRWGSQIVSVLVKFNCHDAKSLSLYPKSCVEILRQPLNSWIVTKVNFLKDQAYLMNLLVFTSSPFSYRPQCTLSLACSPLPRLPPQNFAQLQASQEKLKTMVMQTFGGKPGASVVYVKMVNKVTKVSPQSVLLVGQNLACIRMSVFIFLWISNENDQPFTLRLVVDLSRFKDFHLQLRSNGMTCLGPWLKSSQVKSIFI